VPYILPYIFISERVACIIDTARRTARNKSYRSLLWRHRSFPHKPSIKRYRVTAAPPGPSPSFVFALQRLQPLEWSRTEMYLRRRVQSTYGAFYRFAFHFGAICYSLRRVNRGRWSSCRDRHLRLVSFWLVRIDRMKGMPGKNSSHDTSLPTLSLLIRPSAGWWCDVGWFHFDPDGIDFAVPYTEYGFWRLTAVMVGFINIFTCCLASRVCG